jgi:hypothetical protein
MCLVLVATHCVDGPMTGFKSTETQDGARIAEEPTKKILETQIVSMSSFIMVGSVDRGPARPVGPPNLKSGGFARSSGRARRGAWIPSARTSALLVEQKGQKGRDEADRAVSKLFERLENKKWA